jgi:hypothetical protein
VLSSSIAYNLPLPCWILFEAKLGLWHLVKADVRAGQQDVAAAARHALAHGPLLALRHAVSVLPWAGEPWFDVQDPGLRIGV